MSFNDEFSKHKIAFEKYLSDYLASLPIENLAGVKKLHESMSYSVMGEGKRFRPLLTLLTIDTLGGDFKHGLPFATAIEFVHTYSLIHDDLPVMDNDDERRGRPTNHKVFGDAIALLSGDALLTESFAAISAGYMNDPGLASELVTILSRAAGFRGMVGGQAIDIVPNSSQREEWEMTYLHNLKTGALIQAAVEGGALIAGCETSERRNLAAFGKSLGLAFQIADDLLDHDPSAQEATSFVSVIGAERTKELLLKVSDAALESLSRAGVAETPLGKMIKYNLERSI